MEINTKVDTILLDKMFAIDVVFGCLLLLLAVVFVAAVAVTLEWDSWLNHIFPEYDVCLCCVSVQLMTGARRVIMVLIRECSTHPHASHHPVQLISVLLELWLPLFPKIQSDKLLCSTRHGNYIEMLCNAGNTVNHNEPVFFFNVYECLPNSFFSSTSCCCWCCLFVWFTI